MIANQARYQPVADLAEKYTGFRPSPNTVTRWIRGKSKVHGQPRSLKVIRIARKYMTTPEWLEEFLAVQSDVGQPSSYERDKQAKQKAKADAVAESICDAFKV